MILYLLEFHEGSTFRCQTSNLFIGIEAALLTFSRFLQYREGDLDETFDEIDLIDNLLDDLLAFSYRPFVHQKVYEIEGEIEVKVDIVYEFDRLGHPRLSCRVADEENALWVELDYCGQLHTPYPDLPNDWRNIL